MCLNPPGLKENPRGTPKRAKHKGVKKIEIRVGSDTITLQLDGRGGGTSSSTLHITEADEEFGAEYQAQCWSAGFVFTDRNRSPDGTVRKERKFHVYFNLLNIGSVGSKPYFMKL